MLQCGISPHSAETKQALRVPAEPGQYQEMDMKKLPGSCGPQEEVTQPGLPPEETFTDAPYDTPSQSLTEEQKWPSEIGRAHV